MTKKPRISDSSADSGKEDKEDLIGCHPPKRNSANARERQRMRVLSKAFVKLKTTLPWVPADTKLSKLDTLRLASCYIAHLRQILADDEDSDIKNGKSVNPLSLTWPYTFSGRLSCGLQEGKTHGMKLPTKPSANSSSS